MNTLSNFTYLMVHSENRLLNPTMNLEKQLVDWGICRETVSCETGIYSFSAIQTWDGYKVTMCFWQYCPEDEATEQSNIAERIIPYPHLAIALIRHWLEVEKERGWVGYNLLKEPVRVKDLV